MTNYNRHPHKMAYTSAEACKLLSIGLTTLYKLKNQGKLTPVKIGSATRWRHDDLMRLLAHQASQSTTASSHVAL